MARVSSCLVLSLVITMMSAGQLLAEKPAKKAASASSLHWHTDYAKAMQQAKLEHKMLLVLFHNGRQSTSRQQFEAELSGNSKVQQRLDRYVLARIRTDATITAGGKKVNVFQHPAFGDLKGQQGFAIIDLAHKGTDHYGMVVSAIPFTPGKYYRFQPHHVAVALDLPPGTITQRTMIFAVRIHPEAPASAWGQKDPVLTEEAASHSHHQAQIRVQGHHQWDTRFQRILGRLFGRRRSAPVEVVAESWPNQNLIDSCVDCVHSWRQSPGHWSAVQARQASYGYDIRRGGNGIWYATGIFAK